ncbi:MAG TPA: hypothetical protein DDW90_10175 [Cyanobacteria bacterium UBA9971]|nr:hypothetical protein [Cyanobacteria bacterium UBA9971]
MNDLEIEKRIEGHIESRKTYWTGLYLLSAGLATVSFSIDSLIKIVFFIIGIFLLLFLITIIYNINTDLEDFYKKLKEIK